MEVLCKVIFGFKIRIWNYLENGIKRNTKILMYLRLALYFLVCKTGGTRTGKSS